MQTRSDYYSEKKRNLSYLEILDSLAAKQKAVYNCILEFGPVSTEQIAELLGGYPNYYTGRVKELRDLGLVEYAGGGISSKSGKHVSLWKVKKFDPQYTFKF